MDKVCYTKKIFWIALLQPSGEFGNSCQYAKNDHFRKINNKNEILATGEILFLFIVDTYKMNKKWHMRPLDVSLHWRYLTLSQKVPKNAFWSKSLPKTFLVKNQPKLHCWHCFWSQKWISCKSDKFWWFWSKNLFLSILTYFDPRRTKNRKFWSI